MAYVRRGADPPASQRGDSGTLRATRQALFSQNFGPIVKTKDDTHERQQTSNYILLN